jgi:hypothetical protein
MSVLESTIPEFPQFDDSTVVVEAPAPGAGNWAGAPSAIFDDGVFWLAYRCRRPLAEGRGISVVVARSSDGERFEPVVQIGRDDFGAESFERPALIRRPDGGWRLYLSCATPATKHWWIEAVDADRPEQLSRGRRAVAFAGDNATAVKDPVIVRDGDRWQAWVCVHPLGDVGHEDRMSTWHATSDDGLVWRHGREVLRGRAGEWDARGARATAVVSLSPLTMLYDGRPTAEANWFETTGVAVEHDGLLIPVDAEPIRSPESDGAFRYASAVPLPDGRTRFYFEAARADGAHDLRTVVV